MFLGDSFVGKSFLMTHYLGKRFINTTTVGVEYHTITRRIQCENINYSGEYIHNDTTSNEHVDMVTINIGFWDVIGSIHYQHIVSIYLRYCDVFFLVYDTTNSSTFYNLKSWFQLVEADSIQNSKSRLIVVVANNFNKNRVISTQEGERWAINHNCAFVEINHIHEIHNTVNRTMAEYVNMVQYETYTSQQMELRKKMHHTHCCCNCNII
jgi:small GTP-binding protein